MTGLGRKVWTAGEVLSAADVNGYLMNQTTFYFANAAARTGAIGTPTLGMQSFRADGTALEAWNGSAWVGSNAIGGTIPAAQVTGSIPGSQLSGAITTATINNTNVTNTLTTDATTARTFASTDSGTTVFFTSSSAVSATVGTATALTAGQSITLLQEGAGTVTVRSGAGVTLAGRGAVGTAFALSRYDGASLICVGTNSYRIIGNVRTA